jgi:Glutamate-cysteine ligase
MPLCVQAMLAAVEKICAAARNMLLIPESHTRNIFYLQSVCHLLAIMRHAGVDIRVGSMLPEMTEGGDRNQARGWEQAHAGTDPTIWPFRGRCVPFIPSDASFRTCLQEETADRLEDGKRCAGWGKRAGTVSGYN